MQPARQQGRSGPLKDQLAGTLSYGAQRRRLCGAADIGFDDGGVGLDLRWRTDGDLLAFVKHHHDDVAETHDKFQVVFDDEQAEALLLTNAAEHGHQFLRLGRVHSCGRFREDMLGRFPILKERLNQKAGSLSGGEQQMLADRAR
jgi:hypothetical protein